MNALAIGRQKKMRNYVMSNTTVAEIIRLNLTSHRFQYEVNENFQQKYFIDGKQSAICVNVNYF